MFSFWKCYVLLFALLAPFPLYAADADIIINEIAAYESSDYEWFEIYNKGSLAVDVTGWKFYEANTNHSLTAYRGDLVIDPGEYAVIANKADKVAQKYPSFTGTLIDSSWSSLNESGEQVGLKSSGGTTIEQFTYLSAPDYSLERKNSAVNDYTATNWSEHSSWNTIGAQNSNYFLSQKSSENTGSYLWRPRRGDVLINEVVSDPIDRDQEWVELKNGTYRRIDLNGWRLIDGSGAVVLLSGSLDVGDTQRYVVVPLTNGLLDNAGDKILLQTPEHITIDQVTYGSWDDGDLLDNTPVAIDPHSLARIGTTFNNRDDFRVTTSPTKGTANTITDASPPEQPQAHKRIIISELLPHPSSQETADEFIELTNPGDDPVSLGGWEMSSASGLRYLFPKGETLEPKTYRAYGRNITNLSLKNTGGERVRLIQPYASKPIDEVRYTENALLDVSYARDEDGTFRWTKSVTRGEKNIITQDNRAPEISIGGPTGGKVGDPLTFDASDTVDPDGDPLTFTWNFGDGKSASGPVVHHVYVDEDAFSILLTVSDGRVHIAQYHHITIGETDESGAGIAPLQPTSTVNHTIVPPQKMKKKEKEEARVKNNGPQAIPLSRVRSLPSGSRVFVSGVVSAPPGLINANYFYIAGSGIQVWNPKKAFPHLERGDVVRVAGTLRKNGKEQAIRIENPEHVVVTNHSNDPDAHTVAIQDISEPLEGFLVRVSGTVTEMRWPNIYLGEGDARVRVYVPKNAGIKKDSVRKKDSVTVVGIVSETSGGYRIVPRDQNDIEVEAKSSGEEKLSDKKISPKSSDTPATSPIDSQSDLIRYGLVTLFAALIICGGLFLQYYLDRKKEK